MQNKIPDNPINPGRVALGLEYDGSQFHGWQKQLKPALPTVQESVEKALGYVANDVIKVQCAGRTDARVHASNQVVHFDTTATRSEKAWVFGGNANLPKGIAIKWAKSVSDDFHARFSATARTYRYCIINKRLRPALLDSNLTHVGRTLDVGLMQTAADFLLGERDFSAFRAAGCQSNSPHRNVDYIRVSRSSNLVVTEISANAFLLHMVRNIMGVLIPIGLGEKPVTWADEVIKGCDRKKAGKTAPPEGLYLVQAHYPDCFALPQCEYGPVFLDDMSSGYRQ